MNPPPHPIGIVSDNGLMIESKPQLVRRLERYRRPVERPRRDGITARQSLNSLFVQAHSLARLDCHREAAPKQHF
jgi:hypothetical protein